MNLKQAFIILILVFTATLSMAQQSTGCAVLLKEISGTYEGKCSNGLANGKGTASGQDTYKGMFKDGLPDGKGRYTYSNGNVFEGYWSKGMKNGEGKFTLIINGKTTVQRGYWKNDEYVGTSDPDELYRVTSLSGIEAYSIKRLDSKATQIKVSFYGAMLKNVPEGLNITTSTGQVVKESKNAVIYNYACPTLCIVTFQIRTTGGIRQCNLAFEILQPGNYEVIITNS